MFSNAVKLLKTRVLSLAGSYYGEKEAQTLRKTTHKQVQITGTLTFKVCKGCCFFLEFIVLKMLVLYYIHHFIIPGKNVHNSMLTVEGSLKLDVGQLPRT